MMRSRSLDEGLFENRQRLAVERIRHGLPWLPNDVVFGNYEVSRRLEEEVRLELERRRPLRAGDLMVTKDVVVLERTVREYFNARAEGTFQFFLCQWLDLGAIVVSPKVAAEYGVRLLLFDGDAVYGCDADRNEVVSLDRTVESAGADATFEFFRFSIRQD